MDVKESYADLMASKEFREFVEKDPGFELVHAHIMKEAGKDANWEFGFYHKGRDRMVVFETKPIKRTPEQEVFKENPHINALEIEKTDISFDNAMIICENIRKEKFNSEPVTKYIVTLQNIHKQVWNITLITRAFNLINIRIDSDNGDVISTNKTSISELGIRSA